MRQPLLGHFKQGAYSPWCHVLSRLLMITLLHWQAPINFKSMAMANLDERPLKNT